MHDSATVVTAIKNTQQQLLYNYNMTIQQYPNTQIRLPGFLFGGQVDSNPPFFKGFGFLPEQQPTTPTQSRHFFNLNGIIYSIAHTLRTTNTAKPIP